MPDNTDLATAFERGSAYYDRIGYARRIGYGARPALLIIDMANAWTRPGGPFRCDGIDEIIVVIRDLMSLARARQVPIFFTTTAYEPGLRDAGVWINKIPSLALLTLDSEACRIDDRLPRETGDALLVKKMASAFNGTNLAQTLTACGVDTVLITGVTASGCIRHSAEDCVSAGFRPIVVREAVGDRVRGTVEWNLFDIDAKFGDVEPAERVKRYLAELAPQGRPA